MAGIEEKSDSSETEITEHEESESEYETHGETRPDSEDDSEMDQLRA